MKFTVEQIENGIARCENENNEFVEIEASKLPVGVKSGDILLFDGTEYKILSDETDERKKKMLEMQARLFKKKN